MAEAKASSDTLPGTVFTPRQVRILKWVVIVMGIMLVGGFALVMSAIVYQASHLKESIPAPATTSSSAPMRALAVPAGASISHMAISGNRLAIHLDGPEGSEIRIIDTVSGTLVQRIPITRE